MSKTRYCARCKHPETEHHHGKCSGLVREELPKHINCDCNGFVPKGEDISQSAARIVKRATEGE
jgi:hypothetical protein